MKTFTDAADEFLKESANIGDAVLAPLVAALQHTAKQLDQQEAANGEFVTSLLTEYRRIRNEILEHQTNTVEVDEDDEFLSPQDA